MKMMRVCIAGLVVASLVAAAPARAENTGAKVFVGLAGLAVLAKILEAERAQRQRDQQAAPAPVPQPRRFAPGARARQAPVDRMQRAGRGYRQCMRQRWTRSGWVSYMDTPCVDAVNARRQARQTVKHNRFRARY